MERMVGGEVTPRYRNLQLHWKKGEGSETPRTVAWRIIGVYLILGGLWILLSDRVLLLLVSDLEAIEKISLIKGWFYVLVTALVMYRLVYASLSRVKQAEEQFRYWALHDQLTGLPNRRALYDELQRIMGTPEAQGALILMDLDNFRYINDYLGHRVGDELLGGIGQRLRELEELGAQAYRFAGDEHVLHVPGARQSEAVKVLTRLYDDFAQPFELKNGSHAFLTISTGVVLYPDHGTSAEELLKKADIAMRDAEKVRNSYRFFDDSLAKDVSESITIGQGLRSALFNNELDVEYQPQCDVKTDCVCGFEALLRWNSPSLGPVPPSRFIPLAERSGSIVPMGQMVLERACRFIKKVHTSGYPHATVSVNVSIQQLLRQDYVESVVGTLDREGLDPKYLELEITESLLMESYPLIRDKLSVLRQYGVRIALDDFGTGYSSLRHLRELPISVLKIDKAFLDELQVPGHRILTGEIIAIGKGMGMTIVAEGIEHPEQLAFLKECGCDRFQGYLYSKPLPENAIFSNLSSLAKRGCH